MKAVFYDFPMPNTVLNTSERVIASCWHSDTVVGLVLLGDTPGSYYSVVLAEQMPKGRYVECHRDRFANIVPTAAAYEALTGCWGED